MGSLRDGHVSTSLPALPWYPLSHEIDDTGEVAVAEVDEQAIGRPDDETDREADLTTDRLKT
jgi:hypothetical protein